MGDETCDNCLKRPVFYTVLVATAVKRKIAELEQRAINLEADAVEKRIKMQELRGEIKEERRATIKLGKKNEELAATMTAQYEAMQANVNDLLAEAKSKAQIEAAETMSQAQVEAALASSRERAARGESMREQQKKHAREVNALNKEVLEAKAARFKLESAVDSMLEDTFNAATELANDRVVELSAEVAKYKEEVDSLARVAQILHIETSDRLTDKTGQKSGSALTLGRNERLIILQTAEKCIAKIIEIAAPNGDADGLVKLLQDSGKLSAILETPVEDVSELLQLRMNIVQAFQVYKRQKNIAAAKAFLSLLALTMTIPDLTSLASTHASTSVGDLVAVRSLGHTRAEGVVLSVDDAAETCSVQIHVRSEEAKKMRHVTTAQEAAFLLANMESTDEVKHNVKLKDVAVIGGVRCTEYEVKAARKHANAHFPGKLSVKQIGDFKRIRKSIAHMKVMVEHFEDDSLFPIRYSSSRGAVRFTCIQ